MEIFILKLAVAVIPLVILVVSVTIISQCSSWSSHNHALSRQRTRRNVLRSLAAGIMLRNI